MPDLEYVTRPAGGTDVEGKSNEGALAEPRSGSGGRALVPGDDGYDGVESGHHTAWVRGVWERMEPHTDGSAYVNHLAADDRPEKVRASFGGNYERLVAVKNRYDPDNLFRFNPNIWPSGQA